MKKPIPILLICCLVLGMTAPVSADFIAEYCNANDFTNALVDYCNHNDVRNMTGYYLDIDNYDCRIYDVAEDGFRFECKGLLVMYILLPPPFPFPYHFTGKMNVTGGKTGLQKPYTIKRLKKSICNYTDTTEFIATGPNWVLTVENDYLTRFSLPPSVG